MLPDYPVLEARIANPTTAGSTEFPPGSYFTPTSPKIQELRVKYETLHAINSDVQLHENGCSSAPAQKT